MRLETKHLGDLVENLDSRRVPVASANREAGPYPYYGASGVVDHVADYLFEGDHLLLAEDGENLRTRALPIAFLASGKFWVNNHAHVLRGREGVADTRYLNYALACVDISGYLSGSAQPKLSQVSMNAIQLKVPPLCEQQAIAEVLGALDDKIEINRKIASISESLMIAMVSDLPRTARLKDIAISVKKIVSAAELVSGVIAHYSLPAFDQGRLPVVEPGSGVKSGKLRIECGRVLLSKLNPRFPRVWRVENPLKNAVASTEFIVLESKLLPVAALWAVLADDFTAHYLSERAAGTSGSHQRVSPEEIMLMPVPAEDGIDEQRKNRLRVLGKRADLARSESRTLASLRDALLPALMNGTLRVKDAEKQVSEVL